MSKFIAVTGKLSGKKYLQRMDNVAVIFDNQLHLNTGDVFDIEESLEEIQSKLIRDEFANYALKGLLSDSHRELSIGELSKISYEIADAMLKERMK